ncbi:hypothetical protein ACEWY4_003999 [Coilia grayii]|uniref:Bromo domain-containing protein n=1 Tax=Coilia grayii TaxID=363190 RepID=A0ABD1KKF6_9TELE
MKVQADTGQTETNSFPDASSCLTDHYKGMTDNVDCPIRLVFHSTNFHDESPSGTSSSSTMVNNAAHSKWNDFDIEDELPVVSKETSLFEICLPNATSDSDDISYEVQQAYRIFHDFLMEKHKAITAPFFSPMGVRDFSFANTVQQGMCLKRIGEKFVNREYNSITDFVADFRLMLENCYRCHGVDHWISRQAQKVEMILEQKLTLLSRVLREKTRLEVTSKGRFGADDEKGLVGSTSRRRAVPRNLASVTMGGSESIMVQALRLEEQQRAKEEKRQREQEKKEAEEASVKEVVEWEQNLLSQAAPWPVDTLWEIPAVGHFLCLAQAALNLPEIIFFELERCLLMPRCSSFLAKVMTSLLCQPQRRPSLHRRPPLTYRCWEAELRQRVLGWYHAVGQAENQAACAQELGLCNQFFQTLGETSPLEEAAFHLLPFNKRVWLLKGLCDNVYETEKEVQNAVLGQPIHECRESILGYDSRENAYIHFPHFCGADLRIYCQSPCASPDVPLPAVFVRKVDSHRPLKTLLGSIDGVSSVTEEKCGYQKQKLSSSRELVKEEVKSSTDEVNGVGEFMGSVDHERNGTFLLSRHTDTCSSWAAIEQTEGVENRPQLKQEVDSSSESKPCRQLKNHCVTQTVSPNLLASKFPDGPLKTENMCLRLNLNLRKGQSPCPQCSRECATCSCSETELTPLTSRLRQQDSHQKIHSQKNRKKRAIKELRAQGRRCKAGPVRIRRVRAAKTKKTVCTVKNNSKRKKRKTGKKSECRNMVTTKRYDSSLPAQPTFKLVCSSLKELRELISKTEDEMDELESTKKKSGRWQYRREAVKELHITLIRLLNELSPWEPKLIRAFHKNRARLKKDYDDFKKHPEYDIFIREELLLEDEDFGPAKYLNALMDLPMETEENDKEEKLGETAFDSPQLPDAGETVAGMCSVRQGPLTRTEHQTSAHSSKHHSWSMEDDHSQNLKSKMSTGESIFCTKIEDVSSNADSTTHNQRFPETNPPESTPAVAGVCRRNRPIQALLARSVGNKVTLIRESPTNTTHHMNQAESKVFTLTQTPQTQPAKTGPIRIPSTSPSPSQMVYKVPGGLGLLKKEGSPLNFTAPPIIDQENGEKTVQQVVILPKAMLVQKCENSGEQRGKPCCKTSFTSTPGFSVPVQHVPPVTNSQVEHVPTPVVSLKLHTFPISNSKDNKPQTVLGFGANSDGPISSSSSDSVLSESGDVKQELKTVCIRDSKSILVTTRGGNTGVVKVQTSDKHGASPASPVFNLSPQLKGLLVSTSTQSVKAPSIAEHVSTTTVSQLPTVKITSPRIANPGSTSVGFSCKSTQSVITGNCLIPVVSQKNVNMLPLAVTDASQTSQSKCVTQAPQKRAHPEPSGQNQVPFQKIFLLAPSVSDAPKSTTHSNVTSVPPGTRLMVLSQKSISSLPTVSFSKHTTISPHSTTTGSTAVSKAESIQTHLNRPDSSSVLCKINEGPVLSPGLHVRLPTDVSASSSKIGPPESSAKTVPFCVSRAGAASFSRSVFVQNTTNSSSSLTADNKVKANTALTGSPPLIVTSGHLGPSAVWSANLHNSTPLVVPLSLPSLCQGTVKTPSTLKSTIVTSPTNNLNIKSQGLTGVPHMPSTVSTQTSVSPSSVLPLRVVTPLSPGRGAVVQTPASHTTVRPSAEAKPVTSNTQQKIVINTSAPLAPGTQILINNARFVVPAQGLGPGSHVLLISSLPSASEPRPNVNLTEKSGHGRAGAPVSMPVLPSLQERRVVIPRAVPPQSVCKIPAPTSVKVGPLQSLPVTVCSVRTPVPSVSCSAQICQISGAAVSTGKLNMAGDLRLPSVLTGEKIPPATSVRLFTDSVMHKSAALTKTQESPYATKIPTSLHALSVSTVSKGQLVSRTVASVAKTVTVPFISSSTCRMQAVPIATVQPIDSRLNNRQAVPLTSVSSSSKAVIMTPCQPVSNATPESVALSVVLADSSQNKGTSGLTGLSYNRLLVSPDGAILSSIRDPALHTIPIVPTGAKGLIPSSLVGLEQPSQKVVNSLNLSQPTQGGLNR